MNELKHYGVPGMRWGRRKGRSTSSGSGKKRAESSTKKGRKVAAGILAGIGAATVATVAAGVVYKGAQFAATIAEMKRVW